MKRGVGYMRRRFERVWRSRETCFILGGDGVLYACGRNGHGQLGLGNRTDHSTFEPVKGIEDTVQEMWVSEKTSFLLTDGGQLYACGRNGGGQLGLGDEANRSTFEPVKGIEGTVREMWVTDYISFLLTDGGQLYACGWNGWGQLGLGDKANRSTFEPVKGIEGVVREMWVSGDTSFLLTDSGQLYACGWNSYGQLGLGDEASRHTFVPVKGVKKGTVREMWVTDYTSFLLSDSGQLYACGRNGSGQLGLGNRTDHSTFEPVKGIKKGMVREMWVSADTSFLLTEEGKKYGCGLPLGISIFKEAGGLPEEADFFLLEAERFEYSKNGTISLLSTFYDCLGLLAPYIEGGPIFEEGRGAYEKKV